VNVLVTTVAEQKLGTLDSLLRLGHYVAVLDADWSNVIQTSTQHRNDLDEALEVRRLVSRCHCWLSSEGIQPVETFLTNLKVPPDGSWST